MQLSLVRLGRRAGKAVVSGKHSHNLPKYKGFQTFASSFKMFYFSPYTFQFVLKRSSPLIVALKTKIQTSIQNKENI